MRSYEEMINEGYEHDEIMCEYQNEINMDAVANRGVDGAWEELHRQLEDKVPSEYRDEIFQLCNDDLIIHYK